jgi:hypothetical protein
MSGGISKSAVERALAQAESAPAVVPAEQLPLIPTEAARAEHAKYQPSGRGGGRPPGSPNKRTVAFARYLLSKYRHPLEGLAEVYSRPVDVLAAELSCSKLEAFQLQLTAMRELAPYVAQKLPTMIDARHLVEDATVGSESELAREVRVLAEQLGVTIDLSAIESKTEEKQ